MHLSLMLFSCLLKPSDLSAPWLVSTKVRLKKTPLNNLFFQFLFFTILFMPKLNVKTKVALGL